MLSPSNMLRDRAHTRVGTLPPRGLCGRGGCVLASPLWGVERTEKLGRERRVVRGRGPQRALRRVPSNETENETCGRAAVAKGSALRYRAVGTQKRNVSIARGIVHNDPQKELFLCPFYWLEHVNPTSSRA